MKIDTDQILGYAVVGWAVAKNWARGTALAFLEDMHEEAERMAKEKSE